MKSVEIDRTKRLKEEPAKGHNRWHPDIPPVLEVDPGEEVLLETRDASDCQIQRRMTAADLGGLDAKVAHPLTGPVYVKGAEPGDLLEIEYVDIIPQSYGWTRNRPGAGFLRDYFPNPYLVHWDIQDGWATSEQLPGVRIINGSFMGTAGIAPSPAQLEQWTQREADLVRRGGTAFPPDPEDAIPSSGSVAQHGLRTLPPRENCGNVDAKQLTKGSRLFIPVNVAGALYSAGDGHFAQGDSECCITAIEMGRHRSGPVPGPPGGGPGPRYKIPPLFPSRLFPPSRVGGAPQLHRHHGDAHPRGRDPRGGGPDPCRPQRPAQHDWTVGRKGLVSGTSLHNLQCRRGPQNQQRR